MDDEYNFCFAEFINFYNLNDAMTFNIELSLQDFVHHFL